MEEKRPDLKAALRELAAEESASLGPHLGIRRLIAYRQGTLAAADRETLQEHLSLCERCTERLRELQDFEAAAARGVAAGPEALREQAWESLSRRLPWQMSTVRPITGAARRPRLSIPPFLSAVAAALLLALAGLSVWGAVTVQHERLRLARLEQLLDEREVALASAQRSLAEAERQLAAARAQPERNSGRVHELEAQVSKLTSELEELRRTTSRPEGRDQLASAQEIELSVAPRFVLRGQEPSEPGLRGEGATNSVRLQKGRITMALSLADHLVYPEYRFELVDQNGTVLWSGRRPGSALLGDDGTSVSVSGLVPGRYRLRVEGLQPDRTELLGEYVLEVARP